MNTQAVRIRLIERNLRLKDLAVRSGIDYDRLQKIVNEYRPARPEELEAIAEVLDLPVDSVA
jgi:transcriptional regulator with XRE-family HTH domain